MTHIVSPDKYKTKKAFAEAVASAYAERSGDGALTFVRVSDPSIIDPVEGEVGAVLRILEARGTKQFTVTNHPKRSWYGLVTRDKRGRVVVK